MRRLFILKTVLILFLILMTSATMAAESEMEGFYQRMKTMEDLISRQESDRSAQIVAYNTLEAALNREMERAFDHVMTKMKPSERAKMNEAQHLWQQQREQEYSWMSQAYGPVKPDSQAHLRIVELRNLMMNARVMQLYSYLDTLPEKNNNTTEATNDLKTATIIGFSLGEDACFLDLKDDMRKHFTEVAKSDFCQHEHKLLDKKVALSYTLGAVSEATCAVEHVSCEENNILVLVSDAKIIRPTRRP